LMDMVTWDKGALQHEEGNSHQLWCMENPAVIETIKQII
jgi:hypothetical protein